MKTEMRRGGSLVLVRIEKDNSITVSCRSAVMGSNNKVGTALQTWSQEGTLHSHRRSVCLTNVTVMRTHRGRSQKKTNAH